MTQSTEQAIFSSGNVSATRERQIQLITSHDIDTRRITTTSEGSTITPRDSTKILLVEVPNDSQLTITLPDPSTMVGGVLVFKFSIIMTRSNVTFVQSNNTTFLMGGVTLSNPAPLSSEGVISTSSSKIQLILQFVSVGSLVNFHSLGTNWIVSGNVYPRIDTQPVFASFNSVIKQAICVRYIITSSTITTTTFLLLLQGLMIVIYDAIDNDSANITVDYDTKVVKNGSVVGSDPDGVGMVFHVYFNMDVDDVDTFETEIQSSEHRTVLVDTLNTAFNTGGVFAHTGSWTDDFISCVTTVYNPTLV